ncbi:secreted RxLR effector protein 161-like, partial [Drosophila grimshawi]|uniref:secreted RxLR effector protein 161-like n=1 Tax=Drosophila grimshawi TaxID=7222 RepID=UPI001C9348C0
MSQFNSNYNVEHWKAAKRILRYLSGTKKLGLLYKQTGVVDADWGANLSDRRSYSGQAFILSGAAVCWEARKQRTVALSSTESEYLAMSEVVKEALYLKTLLNSVGKDCAT